MGEPFNDFDQAELSIEAAQKMVGSATMSMDPSLLQAATEAVERAKNALETVRKNSSNDNEEFFHEQQSILNACEEQLKEAKK